MELIQKYKELARNYTFEISIPNSAYHFPEDSAELKKFLEESQKGTNLNSRIELASLNRAVSELEKNINEYAGSILKIVFYNSNTSIKSQTIKSGYTTNLAFLYYASSTKQWIFYAFARGRYVPSSLKMAGKVSSGYNVYKSISQS